MVESSNIFEADRKVMLIIASPGEPYLKSVFEDATRTEQFAERYGFETHKLIGDDATKTKIDLFFSEQGKECI